MLAGPCPKPRSATASSGTASPVLPTTGSAAISARSVRNDRRDCTRIGISRSRSRNFARLALTSPMVAMRTVSLIASVLTPKRAASSSRGVTRISGRSDPADGATLPNPGSRRIALSMVATPADSATGSSPRMVSDNSRSPRSLTTQPRTSGMSANRVVSSCSICFCVRARRSFNTRLTIIEARRTSGETPVGVVPPTTETVVTSGICRNDAAIRSVAPRVSSSVEPGGNSSDSVTRL